MDETKFPLTWQELGRWLESERFKWGIPFHVFLKYPFSLRYGVYLEYLEEHRIYIGREDLENYWVYWETGKRYTFKYGEKPGIKSREKAIFWACKVREKQLKSEEKLFTKTM